MSNITGTAASEILEGGAGDDRIEDREGGADVLRGGGGDDFLWVTRMGSMMAQSVIMEGGDGADLLWVQSYNASSYAIDAGAGNDRIYLIGLAGSATVTTGAGADVIQLGESYSNITATPAMIRVTDFTTGAGGDWLDWTAYLGQTLSNWGGGNPFASGHLRLLQSGADTLLQLDRDGGGNSYSTLFTFENTTASAFSAENLGGFASDGSAVAGQTITGANAGETLSGTGGDDVIQGMGGNDTINGGAGDDQIFGGDGGDTLSGGLGNDRVEGGTDNDIIEDREGGADILSGGGGDDFVYVTRTGSMMAQSVTLEGGDGADRLWVQSYNASNYTIDAGIGDDHIYLIGAAGSVVVATGAGADVIQLNQAYSNITSTPAMIRVSDFATGSGGDRLDWTAYLAQTLSNWGGGNPFASGHLRLLQSGADTLLQLDRDGGGNSYSALFTFQNTTASAFTAENLGGFASDGSVVPGQSITGTNAGETLSGTGGDDVILGMGGNDRINGGAGDDQIFGGEGVDDLSGSLGNDLVEGGAGNDSIEDLDGGADTLRGGDGDDFVFVTRTGSMMARSIIMEGGAGNDRLWVQSYNDSTFTIDAGIGDDLIHLGLDGAVAVTTGAGADVIELNAGYSNLTSTPAVIRITDFATGAGGDRLDWNAYLAQTLSNWGGGNPFASGHVRLLQSGADTLLQVDRDGGGNSYSTLFRFQNTGASAFTAENLTYTPVSSPATATVSAPASLTEGQTGAISLTFLNVTQLSTTVTADIVRTDSNGVETVLSQRQFQISVTQSPPSDYVYSLGQIGLPDDLAAGGDGAISVCIRATGQSFGLSGDAIIVTVPVADNDGIGSSADDILQGDDGINYLEGADGADVLLGYGGADTLVGGSGNDRLDGGSGADSLSGGSGDDVYYIDNSNDLVVESDGQGRDIAYASVSHALAGSASIETLVAVSGAGPISLTGSSFANTLIGNAHDNVLRGGGGDDTLFGDDGDDRLVGDAGNDSLAGGRGSDVYVVDGGDVVIEAAGEGVDRVQATDSFALRDGQAVEFLELFDPASTARIDLWGNELHNTLIGGAGVNILRGGAGGDILYGLAGDDYLDGGDGADFMGGGLGNDTYYLNDASDQFSERAGEGADRVATSVTWRLASDASIEIMEVTNSTSTDNIDLFGNAFDQLLAGNFGDNVIFGDDGADELVGYAGADVLDGGAGNDVLIGGAGVDRMTGGGGNDKFYVDDRNDTVSESGDGGVDTVVSSVSYTLAAGSRVENFEPVTFSSSESLNFSGNEFANRICGNIGDNILNGGAGSDVLEGLAGSDTFVFADALGASNIDTINDFSVGVDRILLDGGVFGGLGLGSLDSAAFVTGDRALGAGDRIIYNRGTGALWFDPDGSGAAAAIQFAVLGSGLNLSANDFLIADSATIGADLEDVFLSLPDAETVIAPHLDDGAQIFCIEGPEVTFGGGDDPHWMLTLLPSLERHQDDWGFGHTRPGADPWG